MKYLIVVFSCFMLASCTGYQKPVVLTPSDSLIADCTINQPPKLTGNAEKDKLVLSQAWINQTANLGKCSQRMKMIQTWKQVQLERFGKEK